MSELEEIRLFVNSQDFNMISQQVGCKKRTVKAVYYNERKFNKEGSKSNRAYKALKQLAEQRKQTKII